MGLPAENPIRSRGLSMSTEDSFVLDCRGEDNAVTASEKLFYRDVIAVIPGSQASGFIFQPNSPEYLLLMMHQEPKPNDNATDLQHWKAGGFGFKMIRVCLASLPEELSRYLLPGIPKHLDVSGDRDLFIIVSTLSGAGEAQAFFEKIVEPVLICLGLAKRYTLCLTTTERSVTELVEQGLASKANWGISQTLLLLSGDGGIVDVINGLVKNPQTDRYMKPVIGLLALGTGNALANSCGLNEDSTKGLSVFLRGGPHSLPTFQAKFSPGSKILSNEGRETESLPITDKSGEGYLHGAVVASWALHASLVADSDTTEYRTFGDARFAMAAKELIAPSDGSAPHHYRGKVTLFKHNDTGQAFPVHWERDSHMYLLATFVSNLEKTLTISPRSKPLDGKLRILHFGVLTSDEIQRIFGLAYLGGKHVNANAVGYESIDGFRIDFDEQDARWRRVCVDGKIVVVSEGGWVEVRKQGEDILDLVVDASA